MIGLGTVQKNRNGPGAFVTAEIDSVELMAGFFKQKSNVITLGDFILGVLMVGILVGSYQHGRGHMRVLFC
jgi:hypothetical protein